MKITAICLLVVLTCSCHEAVDNPKPELSEATAERREEVRKIISRYLHHVGIDVVRGPFTVKEVQKELVEDARAASRGGDRVIAGGPEWRQLKAKLKRGDELYFYETDRESWAYLRGRAGYVAIRGNEVIGDFLTVMN